jgi:hypothetical protein
VSEDITHAYEISDLPGARLYVGAPPGRTRPALYIEQVRPGGVDRVILAQFNGPREVQVAVHFLDALIGQIQRIADHYTGRRPDEDEGHAGQ